MKTVRVWAAGSGPEEVAEFGRELVAADVAPVRFTCLRGDEQDGSVAESFSALDRPQSAR
jgi:hypothetical protein